jgi:uncharacterized protein
MSTEITVRGSHAEFQPPERGTVHASISYEGGAMDAVYERVAQDLETVKSSVLSLHDPDRGPVTWWSVEQLRTWSARPWNDRGEQLPLVHHASVGLEVKFSDFQALSRWVAEHTTDTEGFRVGHVQWALTVKRRDELAREVRTLAVQDAVTRAQQYADAVGLGTVVPVAIADAGMLGTNRDSESGHFASRMHAMPAPAGMAAAEVELIPEDIEVRATVDARFLADVGTSP